MVTVYGLIIVMILFLFLIDPSSKFTLSNLQYWVIILMCVSSFFVKFLEHYKLLLDKYKKSAILCKDDTNNAIKFAKEVRMTAEDIINLEKQFEEFKLKPVCVHPALFWSGRMAEMVRNLEQVPLGSSLVGIYLERMFYFESRYTDEIIKYSNKIAKE